MPVIRAEYANNQSNKGAKSFSNLQIEDVIAVYKNIINSGMICSIKDGLDIFNWAKLASCALENAFILFIKDFSSLSCTLTDLRMKVYNYYLEHKELKLHRVIEQVFIRN